MSVLRFNTPFRGLNQLLACLATSLALAAGTTVAQQLTPDEQAAQVLAAARRGYDEGNYPFAVERFKEFLQKYGGHKDAVAARYGLGLSLIEGPKDYPAAIDALNGVVGNQEFVDRPLALYYLGSAQRSIGYQSLALAAAKPPEAPQHLQTARQRFEQALPQFAAAAVAFQARVKEPLAADAKTLPADLEWALRARCDQAEMLLQLGKFLEAKALLDPLAADVTLPKSRFRDWVLYYQGHAAFELKDYLTAGRALGQLAPFSNPALGLHARYLLARTHHLADQRAEAAVQYEAVLTGYEEQKKTAPQALQNAELLKNNPAEKLRLESLLNSRPPDYVARASFYSGVLLYEDGRFTDAATRFTNFPQQYPQHALIPEAQFRLGVCQAQLKQFAEALKNLQPYQEHPQLSDQALWWLSKAQIGAADPKNVPAFEQAVRGAIELLRRGAERAGQKAGADPQAKLRRADILLDMADTQQLAKLNSDAAGTYQQVINENIAPDRVQEAHQRRATALNLAGKYAESDDVCRKFVAAYPQSPLLPAVLFRYAENSFLTATAAFNNPQLGNREQELAKLFGESLKRYQDVVEKFPEFGGVQLARQGMAMSQYRLGQFEAAAALLAAIPESDRNDELGTVPYVLADCLLRTLPTDTSDALAAARVMQQVDEAVKLLNNFVAAQPQSPQAADALLKLGFCYQQIAGIVVEPQERGTALNNARQAYDRILQQFATHPVLPLAVFERAKCMLLAGDPNSAANELQRFQQDPLSKSPVAPLALLRLSDVWRSQKKAAEAVNMLTQARAAHEGALLNDPARKAWAPLLQYHLGLALKDSAKLPEARALFENMTRQFPGGTEAIDAAWRAGQCRRLEALAKLEPARKVLDQPASKPEEKQAASAIRDQAAQALREAGQYLHDAAAHVPQPMLGGEGHVRLLYEAAWCCRLAGDQEIDAARQKLVQEALVKLQAEAVKNTPAGQQPLMVRAPEVKLSAIPVQPSEQRARDEYKGLIAAGPDAPLAIDARLELAEMHVEREEYAPATALLTAAFDKEPPEELAERIALRLGHCYLATDNLPEALARFEFIARNAKSPLLPEARYRVGECLVRAKDWSKAVEALLPFRDQQPFQNVAGVSDRALLRLGQSQGQLKQWDPSRQSLETLVNRFPNSTWVDEARYGMGWAWQNQNQHDQAVNTYAQVVARTAAEVAARAQLQIGLCRLDQKRFAEAAQALMTVPMTYAYAEPSAIALCEAGRAYLEAKQPEEARKVLARVSTEYPNSRWAEIARTRLAEIK